MRNWPTNWHNYTFLVADDEEALRFLMARLLRRVGVKGVFQVKNGQEALPYLAQRATMPDCIIADIGMTPINGVELAFIIRSDKRVMRHDVPILFVSGHPDADLVSAARALDVNGFIIKPSSNEDIVRRIESALSVRVPIAPRQVYASKQQEIFSVQHPLLRGSGQFHVEGGDDRSSGPVEILLRQVPMESVLARSIVGPDGTILLARGELITREHVLRLEELLGSDGLKHRVCIFLPKAIS